MKRLRVAFVHGRPSANPTHIQYARSLHADFFYVDHKIRYHDVPATSGIRRYASWLVSALTFPVRKYNVIFSEEAYFMVGLMKWLGLLKKDQKIVALMSTHTLFFLHSNQYAASTKKASIKLLKTYDGFICSSLLQKELLLNLIGRNSAMPIYTFFNGVEESRLKKLVPLKPDLGSSNIVFIGAVPNRARAWTKGLDLMLAAFAHAKAALPDLNFTVIGDYDPTLKDELISRHCAAHQAAVQFVGNVNNIESYLKDSALYLHMARGEAWGISVTEAMAAGVVPLVSDATGAMQAVRQVDESLVTGTEVSTIAQKIIWYFKLPLAERTALSQKCKDVITAGYSEKDALAAFKKQFESLMLDLGVKKEVEE